MSNDDKPVLGTADMPDPQPVPGGGPKIMVANSLKNKSVVIDFGGESVAWLRMPAADARLFAEAILKNAELLETKLKALESYTVPA